MLVVVGCGRKPSAASCDFQYFETTSGVPFPEDVEIVSCYDSTEGDIWVFLKFSETATSNFLRQLDFHVYSSEPVFSQSDRNKSLPSYPDNQALETVAMVMGKQYVEIPKDDTTYLRVISKERQFLTYILNRETGMFWGHIAYPDWSGDF